MQILYYVCVLFILFIHVICVLHMYLFDTGILSLTPICFGADLGGLSLLFLPQPPQLTCAYALQFGLYKY